MSNRSTATVVCIVTALVLLGGCGGGASGPGAAAVGAGSTTGGAAPVVSGGASAGGSTSGGGTSGGSTSGGSTSRGTTSGGSTSGGSGTVADVPGNTTSPLGTNLDDVRDYSSQQPFVDLMKTSRAWISGSSSAWDDGRPVDTDANGWVRSVLPGQIVRTLMLVDQPTRVTGRHFVLYEGSGTIGYALGASKVASLSTPGRDVVDFDSSRGAFELDIVAVHAANPLRNIRVVPEGGVCSDDAMRACQSDAACGSGSCQMHVDHAERIRFRPEFLAQTRSYRQIRFMDWMSTNGSPVSRWSDRARLEHARWSTERGVPVEVMVALANTLRADPWFTLPHQADDDFARNFAAVVRDQLQPGLKAWVEYSNEVWNGIYAQAGWISTRGLQAGLSSDPYEARSRMYVRRSLELFTIFADVLGSGRVHRVLASQAANAWLTDQILGYQGAATRADAIAIAPYFGTEFGDSAGAAAVRGLGVDAFLDRLERESLPIAVRWMKEQAAVARQYRLELVAYEGGQHLVGLTGLENDAQLGALFDRANAHPRMRDLYLAYLGAWRQSGGQAFAHFVNCGTWSKWGRWGALQYQGQPRAEAPKFDALMTFIEQNPQWW